jgi:conjugal transfer pilus assembly protein TraV
MPMHRSIPLAALALSLAGCTHLGTNIAGDFSCRSPKTGCQPLSEVDAKAIRELVKSEGTALAEVRQRVAVPAADTTRTGERTLKVVFPAHVDGSGSLYDEAVAWTVVEAARWAGELRRDEAAQPKGTMRALRQALKDQARRTADAAHKADTDANPEPLSPEDSAPAVTGNPFQPSSPLALPSPGGEAPADVTTPVQATSAAEGSNMSPTPHVRAPRPLEESRRTWPSAAAIEAAKALKHSGNVDAGAAPSKEPK